MTLRLWENLFILIGALFSFCFGLRRHLKPNKALYATMIVLAMGCLMLGRLYQSIRILTGFSEREGFHVGVLGVIGAFSFFFSSNYGAIDSLVDDGGPAFRRYRVIAWTGPAMIAALYLPVAFGPQSISGKIISAVVSCFIASSCYFHVKHMLIPDVDYGVVRSLRRFNMVALVFGALCMLEMIAEAYALEVPLLVVSILTAFTAAAIVPVMDWGVRSWRT